MRCLTYEFSASPAVEVLALFENESTPAPVLLMMSGDGDRGFATNSWRSRVDVKKHARYGYADSGYYQGYYRKYNVN